nr:MAG TPA: hypothetical protein [Caudoviricetes sp.]
MLPFPSFSSFNLLKEPPGGDTGGSPVVIIVLCYQTLLFSPRSIVCKNNLLIFAALDCNTCVIIVLC